MNKHIRTYTESLHNAPLHLLVHAVQTWSGVHHPTQAAGAFDVVVGSGAEAFKWMILLVSRSQIASPSPFSPILIHASV